MRSVPSGVGWLLFFAAFRGFTELITWPYEYKLHSDPCWRETIPFSEELRLQKKTTPIPPGDILNFQALYTNKYSNGRWKSLCCSPHRLEQVGNSADIVIRIANFPSGLGFSLAHRLLDEFMTTHPSTDHLTLIITTRSAVKGAQTLSALTKHLVRVLPPDATKRIQLAHYQVDLSNLVSVEALAKALTRNYSRLDYVFLNAGMGAFEGIDWLKCFGSILRNWVQAVTFPAYKLQAVGWKTTQPAPVGGEIGSVFCANVFGHYYLAHELMGLLSAGSGRIIWTSSMEAYGYTFKTDDIEGIKATHSYESTKRLTDIISLTSELPSTAPYASPFFRSPAGTEKSRRPKMYLTHPGVCATSIVPLNMILFSCMTLAFYIARWIGSPWHTIDAYSGAKAAVWVAMTTDEELDAKKAGYIKWGSATDRCGRELVKPTEVEGGGSEEMEELGRDCWRQMEELRVDWKKRLSKR